MQRLFHVHTYRCCHAENIGDEAYIREAIKMGAESITFTDHAPFPDNPFGNRMKYEELQEYVDTLKILGKKYKGRIHVEIGLELEFLPNYMEYYRELQNMGCFDLLMIGQHFYQHENGEFSFSDNAEDKKNEMFGLGEAICQGILTGLFRVVAHPDRIFRRRKLWDKDMEAIAEKIIISAMQNNVILERNISSERKKFQYWPQFWEMVKPENKMVVGIDAHSLDELHSVERIRR